MAEDRGRCLLTPGPPSLFASSIRSLVHPSTATRGSRRLRPVRPHVGTSDFRACTGEGEKLGWGGRWGWGVWPHPAEARRGRCGRQGWGTRQSGVGGDPGPLVRCCRCVVSNSTTPRTAGHQAPLSSTISWSLLKLTSIESVMPSNRLMLVAPFSSCLQSFSASGSFPRSQLFVSTGQSIGASASVLKEWDVASSLATEDEVVGWRH